MLPGTSVIPAIHAVPSRRTRAGQLMLARIVARVVAVAGGGRRRGWRIELCTLWRVATLVAPCSNCEARPLRIAPWSRRPRWARLCSIVHRAGGWAMRMRAWCAGPAALCASPRASGASAACPGRFPARRCGTWANTTRVYKSPHTSQPLSFSSSPTLVRHHQNSNDLPRRSPCCPRCPRAAARRAPLRVQHAQEGVPGRLRRVRPLPQA